MLVARGQGLVAVSNPKRNAVIAAYRWHQAMLVKFP